MICFNMAITNYAREILYEYFFFVGVAQQPMRLLLLLGFLEYVHVSVHRLPLNVKEGVLNAKLIRKKCFRSFFLP